MAVTYSQDLRDRVLAAYARGMKTSEIARTFNVSPAWARRVRQVQREEGRTTPLPRGGARVIKIDVARLAELVREQPDATLEQLRVRLGVDCSAWAIGLALRRMNLTFKKKRSTRPSRIGRTSPSSVNGGAGRKRNAPVGD